MATTNNNFDYDANTLKIEKLLELIKHRSPKRPSHKNRKYNQPPGVRDKTTPDSIEPQSLWNGKVDVQLDPATRETAEHLIDTMKYIADSLAASLKTSGAPETINKSLDELSSVRKALEQISPDSFKDGIKSGMAEMKTTVWDIVTDARTRNFFMVIFTTITAIRYGMSRDPRDQLIFYCVFGFTMMVVPVFGDKSLSGHLNTLYATVSKERAPPQDTSNKVEPQIDNDGIDGVTGAATTVLIALTSGMAGKKCPQELFKGLSGYTRVKASLSEITAGVLKVIENVHNWVRNNYFDLPSEHFLHTNSSIVNDFLDEVSGLQELERQGKFYRDDDHYTRLVALIKGGELILQKLPRVNGNNGALESLRGVLKELSALRKIFEASSFNMTGSRQEPVGVMFKGGPGVGKSICMEHLNYAVLAALLDNDELTAFKSNPSTFVFNRMFETKFWDGFTPQKMVTMFDDFGQIRDVVGNPDGEAANAMRAGSGFEMSLNMAELTQKGSSVFKSKFMFATTNMRKIEFESILSNEALLRRWDFTYIVCPKRKYCTKESRNKDYYNRRFDVNKLPTQIVEDLETKYKPGTSTISTLNPDMQEFHRVHKITQELMGGNPLTFNEVVAETLEAYQLKRLQYLAQARAFGATAARYEAMFAEAKDENDLTMDDVKPQGLFGNPLAIAEGGLFFTKDDGLQYLEPLIEQTEIVYDHSLMDEAIKQAKDLSAPHIVKKNVVDDILGGLSPGLKMAVKWMMNEVSEWEPETEAKNWTMLEELCDNTFEHKGELFQHPYPLTLYNLLRIYGTPFKDAWAAGHILVTRPRFERYVYDMPPIAFSFTALDKIKAFMSELKVRFTNWWNDSYLRKAWDLISPYTGYILAGVAALAGYFTYKGWTSVNEEDGETEGESFGFSDRMKTSTRKLPKYKNPSSSSVRARLTGQVDPQGSDSIDSSGVNLFKSVVSTSVYQLHMESGTGTETFNKPGYVFLIKGTVVCMPMHFIKQMLVHIDEDETYLDAKVVLKKSTKQHRSHEYVMKVRDVLMGFREGELAKNDLVLVDLGTKIQVGVNRVKNFCTRDDFIKTVRNIPFIMAFTDRDEKEFFTGVAQASDVELQVSSKELGDYTVRKHYTYRAMTGKGDCGAPFGVLNPSCSARKFFGFHIAGNSGMGVGYSGVVCQEDLLEDLKLFEDQVDSELSIQDMDASDVIVSQGQFNTIGKLNKSPLSPSYSHIVKSKMHGFWKRASTGTAQLSPFESEGQLIDPWELALSKYCTPGIALDRALIDTAADDYFSMIADLPNGRVEPRLLTNREALNGSEGEYKGIASSTSAGYPFNVPGMRNDKKWLFEEGREGPGFEDRFFEFENLLGAVENSYRLGIRPTWLFTDCLKDERRELEKCAEGKTRMFSACPFYYLVLFKKYFGAFQMQYMNQRIENGSAVGVNPYSTEWHHVAEMLSTFDEDEGDVGAGDFSGYDGSEKPDIHWAVLDGINKWYNDGPINMMVRRILWLEVVNSRHIVKGTVVEWCSSLPSGHPLTIIINCIYNHILFRCCWIKLGLVITDFRYRVYLIVCGDDNAYTVHPSVRETFNELSIVAPMAELGMKYTTELKGTAIHKFRKLSEIEFLKRGFREEAYLGRYVAPLRLDVVLEIPFWTKKKGDRDNIAASNLMESLKELALHGQPVYEEWAPKLVKGWETCYPDIDPPGSLRQRFSDRLNTVTAMEYTY